MLHRPRPLRGLTEHEISGWVSAQPILLDNARLIIGDGSVLERASILIDGHAHLGYQGSETWGAENYGRENLIDNLQRYA